MKCSRCLEDKEIVYSFFDGLFKKEDIHFCGDCMRYICERWYFKDGF